MSSSDDGVLLVEEGVVAAQMGGWPAPFGITLVADHLSAVLVMITAIVNLAVTSYSKADIDAALIARGYYPLLQMLVCGICGAFLTGDIFNLYVWFEVMLMASFGLLVMGRSPGRGFPEGRFQHRRTPLPGRHRRTNRCADRPCSLPPETRGSGGPLRGARGPDRRRDREG